VLPDYPSPLLCLMTIAVRLREQDVFGRGFK
jgi:hypothetical protein